MFNFKKETASEKRMAMFEDKYLEAKGQLKELEFEKKNIKQELDLEKRRLQADMELQQREFEQEKRLWESEKSISLSNLKGQLVTKFEQDKAAIKAEYDSKLVKAEATLNEGFYTKMTDALNDLHTKGNHSTQFVQDIAMKMMDRQLPAAPAVEYVVEEE